MNKQELKEKISERIGRNLYYMSCVVTNDNVRKELAANNDILNELLLMIKKGKDIYNEGVKDAWELAQKIDILTDEVFDSFSCRYILDHYTYQEALAKVQEYEKKKAEESKLVPGDVVEFESIRYGKIKGIFIKYEDDDIVILSRKGGSYRLVGKDVWNIEKTGEHVDISGLIGVLYE